MTYLLSEIYLVEFEPVRQMYGEERRKSSEIYLVEFELLSIFSTRFPIPCLKSTLWNLNFIRTRSTVEEGVRSEIYLVEFKPNWRKRMCRSPSGPKSTLWNLNIFEPENERSANNRPKSTLWNLNRAAQRPRAAPRQGVRNLPCGI